MRVLIGYDGSSVTERVIEDLKYAGLPNRVLASVLTAADVYVPGQPGASTPVAVRSVIAKAHDSAQESLRVAQSLADYGAKELKNNFPEWKVFPEACADTPAWALVRKADVWKADLVVMGAHGHSRLGRYMGSVSQMVLAHTTTSVRVARPHLVTSDHLRILIGFDGSKFAQAAIAAVANRAWTVPIDVCVVAVIEPQMSMLMKAVTPAEIKWFLEHDGQRHALGRLMETAVKPLRKKAASVSCEIESGDPKRILVDQAQLWGADTIFLGARGLGNLKRFLIGGVSTAVAARAHCSVEVVR